MMSSWTDKNGLRQRLPLKAVAAEEKARARRFVASQASCAADCRQLLDMLGLGFTAEEIAERRAATGQDHAANTVIRAVGDTEEHA